jgi:hypothetical protein
MSCHAERSEASIPASCKTLRFAQGDMVADWMVKKIHVPKVGMLLNFGNLKCEYKRLVL